MSTYNYLQNQQYYEDLYDKHTVEECRDWVKHVLEHKLPEKARSWPEEEQMKLVACVIDVPLFYITGERYLRREETIDEWMKKARTKAAFVASHPAPTAYCPKCNQKMALMVDELDSDINDENLRMIFLYKCKPCNEKKGIYSDGEPYIFKFDFCPKCNKEWKRKRTKSKTKITTRCKCQHCGYSEEDVFDMNEKCSSDIPDPGFEKDRAKYCISEEAGKEYRHYKEVDAPQIKEMVDSWKDKEEHKEIYEQAQNVKQLTISELSDLLAKKLAKVDFKGLVITNTEVTRDLIITFTVQDTKPDRDEGHSRSDLKKSLKKILNNTNWKLMSDGVSYKLGLLSGRLRGIDKTEVIYEELKEEKGFDPAYQMHGKDGEIINL